MYILAIFLLLISGSIFLSIFYNKRFAETISLNCMFISAVLYIFGLFGILKIGVYVITFVIFTLIVISFVYLIKNKIVKNFLKNFIKSDFILFTILYVFLFILTFKKVAGSWDEFSYWLSSVKDMTYLDDFITNPKSSLGFKSYPPIMGLFQYYFEKIYFYLNKTDIFFEGLAFFAYKIFCLSFFFTFYKKESFNSVINCILSLFLFLIPVFFFDRFYISIYIDPFVGILAGTAIARIFLHKNKDIFFVIFISLNVFTLVLAKDVGLYFAVFVSIIYAIDYFYNHIKIKKSPIITNIFFSIIPLVITLITKITWKIEIILSKIPVSFSNPFDFKSYFNMYFLHNDSTYRQTVVDNFQKAFFENRFKIGDIFGLKTSYFIITIILVFLLIMLTYTCKKKLNQNKYNLSYIIIICAVLFFMVILYVFCLGETYVARFSEYEALRLASYERYLNIAYLTVYCFIALYFYNYTLSVKFKNHRFINICVIFILSILLHKKPTGGFLIGYNVKKDLKAREPFNILNKKIQNIVKEKSKIYFISQEDSGYDELVMAFICKPHEISGAYSLGPAFYDGDIWSIDMSIDDFNDILFNEDYDYLAIFKTNDYFSNTYKSIFESPEDISDNTLFKLNKVTKKVELCQ